MTKEEKLTNFCKDCKTNHMLDFHKRFDRDTYFVSCCKISCPTSREIYFAEVDDETKDEICS